MSDLTANIRNLTDPHLREADEEVFQADHAGGGHFVSRHEVTTEHAEAALDDGDVLLTFEQPGGRVESTLAGLELPANWESFGELELDVTNGQASIDFDVVVLGSRCRLIHTQSLKAGARTTITAPLRELPLAAGNRPLYEPTGVRLIARFDEHPPCHLRLHGMKLRVSTEPAQPLIDRFGQRIHSDWSGKIADEEDLRHRARTEAGQLATAPDLPGRDEYGGWTGGPKFEATGFFRVHRDDDGRWWLVDPAGNPFWSVGVTSVRIDANEFTDVSGREHIYAELPPVEEPLARSRQSVNLHRSTESRDLASFYAWNILRKYGSEEAWADCVLARLPKWGLNTVGSFTHNELFIEQTRVPHCRIARTRCREGSHAMAGKRFPDVFDPAWEPWLDGVIAELTDPCRDNPWLIGYFIDNEAPWRNPRLLDAPAGGPLRAQWRQFAHRELGTVQAFNDAFAADARTWDDVEGITDAQVPPEGPGRELMASFEELFAERYFATIAKLIRKHDPNHMYLGCRFVKTPPERHILRAMGRHVDVCSVNCYTYPVERELFEEFHNISGRPILIGEFHFPLDSPRQLPPLYSCYTNRQRREMALGFFRAFAEMPFALGCHWFQHADQPLMGRASNGENQPVGLVDITDTPHELLLEAFRAAGENAVRWHAGAK